DGIKDIVDIILFVECSCRTCRDTLSASDTARVSQPNLECRADKCGESPVIRSDDPHGLDLLTDCRASPAEDAFIVVAYHMDRARIKFIMISLALKIILIVDAQLLAKLLQLTFSASHTGEALLVMYREQKLKRPSPGFQQLLCIR